MAQRRTQKRVGTPAVSLATIARLLALLAASAPDVRAQQAAENALQLARAGESDRAELACQEILSNPQSTQDDRAAVDFIRGEVSLTQALQERDAARADDLLDESLDRLQRFVKRNGTHPLASEARRGIDWRRHRKAERAARAARSELDLKLLPEREKRANDLYASLAIHYSDRIRAVRAMPRHAGEHQAELMDLRLDFPRGLLEHARLPGLEEERRRGLLAEAMALLQDFQLDNSDNAAAFAAFWLDGQCHAELGSVQRAEDRFRAAVSLRSRLREAGVEATDECLRTIRNGQLSLVDLLLKAGQTREALDAAEKALAAEASDSTDEGVLAMRLLVADCRFQMEEFAAAQEAVALVAQADPEGRIGAFAREKSRIWAADPRVRGSQSTPERSLAAAESQMEKESWLSALSLLRQAIEGCGSPEELRRIEPPARFKMGQCFSRIGRNHESAFAFERLVRGYPEHELAPTAAFEAARSLAAETSASGEPEDESMERAFVESLLDRWPTHAATLNLPFLQAEKAEKAREFDRAASGYLAVKREADAFEAARVAAARCLYVEAASQWEKAAAAERTSGGSAAGDSREQLRRAEEILREFLAGARGSAGAGEPPFRATAGTEAARQREQLVFQATQQLALILSHDAVARAQESLDLLAEYSRTLSVNHPRLSRVWGLQVRAHLSLGRLDEAATVVDAIFERFPESPSLGPAARSAALQLRREADELAAKKADLERVQSHSRRVHRYLMRWLNDPTSRGQRVASAEAIAAAEAILDAARRINGIADGTPSFLDPRAGGPRDPQPFRDAAVLYDSLAQGKFGPLKDKERLGVLISLARTSGFVSADLRDWQKAHGQYAAAVEAAKVLGADGKLQHGPLQANPALLSVYLELGGVLLEMGRSGQKLQIDEALSVFGAVLGVTAAGSEPWWIAKHLQVTSLYERGRGADVQLARTLLDNLEKNYPSFDEDRYKIKTRLLALKAKLIKLAG